MLGRMNVPNIVLEKAAEITTDPRGIALDEDGIRMIQAIGMYERVFTRFALCTTIACTNCRRNDLDLTAFQAKRCSSFRGAITIL